MDPASERPDVHIDVAAVVRASHGAVPNPFVHTRVCSCDRLGIAATRWLEAAKIHKEAHESNDPLSEVSLGQSGAPLTVS